MSFEILNTAAITAAIWGYALISVIGLALVAAVGIPAVARNRSLRLSQHKSLRQYYGNYAFTH